MLEWRTIAEFPAYEVSERGDIRRVVKSANGQIPKILKLNLNIDGYRTVTLTREYKQPKTRFCHKLVALAFLGSPSTSKHQVAHADGSRTNNHFSNLRWATAKENQADRWKHGTRAWGKKSHLSRLTEEGVADIRERFSRGEKSIRALAKIHGVSKLTIADIVRNRSWVKPSNEHSTSLN